MPPLTPIPAAQFVADTTPIPDDGFVIFRMAERPAVVMIDFADQRRMARSLERISIFVETFARRKIPTLAEWAEMATSHDARACTDPSDTVCGLAAGHDLRTADIATFLNVSRTQRIPLTAEESTLAEQLLAAGVLRRTPAGQWRATATEAVLAIARHPDLQERLAIFQHEACHMEFFLDPAFRRRVSAIWRQLPEAAQALIRAGFAETGLYNPKDTTLVTTELHAYVATSPAFMDPTMADHVAMGAFHCLGHIKDPLCAPLRRQRVDAWTLLMQLDRDFWDISACQVPLLATAQVVAGRLESVPPPSGCRLTPPRANARFADQPTLATRNHPDAVLQSALGEEHARIQCAERIQAIPALLAFSGGLSSMLGVATAELLRDLTIVDTGSISALCDTIIPPSKAYWIVHSLDRTNRWLGKDREREPAILLR